MAQEEGGTQPQGEGTQSQQQARQADPTGRGEGAQQGGRTYTDADVDAIIAKKFARWQEQQEAKVAEAAKLAEMNATQKAFWSSAVLTGNPTTEAASGHTA